MLSSLNFLFLKQLLIDYYWALAALDSWMWQSAKHICLINLQSLFLLVASFKQVLAPIHCSSFLCFCAWICLKLYAGSQQKWMQTQQLHGHTYMSKSDSHAGAAAWPPTLTVCIRGHAVTESASTSIGCVHAAWGEWRCKNKGSVHAGWVPVPVWTKP